MFTIIGVLYSPAGLSWEILGKKPWDQEVGLSVIFPFLSPPSAREARQRVETELLGADDVNWFRLRSKTWVVDLEKLRDAFKVDYPWLNRVVTILPEYDLLPDTFKKTEMRGTLSLVLEPDRLGQHETTWGEYLDDELDALLPVLSRRALDRDVRWLFEAATGDRTSALAMIDIDHFKKVNDDHGHLAGDAVLVRVAQIVRDITGRRGTAYRYGGEELTILLPDFAAADSAAVVERVREAVAAAAWPEYDGLKVTISAGIAEGSSGAASADVVRAADQALYVAKHGGRNRVEMATERVHRIREPALP